MIRTVAEFANLRNSKDPADQTRATMDAADDKVWLEVIEQHPDLRKWVAQNKTVSLSIIRQLIDDVDPVTRSWVARKRKLDRAMFVALSTDADERVRHALATNAKLPPDLLRLLSQDPIDLVATEAQQRLTQRAAAKIKAETASKKV
jgi:Leucine rich repeat variant